MFHGGVGHDIVAAFGRDQINAGGHGGDWGIRLNIPTTLPENHNKFISNVSGYVLMLPKWRNHSIAPIPGQDPRAFPQLQANVSVMHGAI
jgi:hypothetical protein